MSTAFDAALEAGATTRISNFEVQFTKRGSSVGATHHPDAATLTVNRSTTPTATATLTFINPTFIWQNYAPSEAKLTQARISIIQAADTEPVAVNTASIRLWISEIEAIETEAGTEVTITANSADWILTNHRFRQDIRREVVGLDVDNFWYSRFMFPTTGHGLDSLFQEFVALESGLDGNSPGAPAEAWIPIPIGSTMWDVAASLAGYWQHYFVAGLIKIGEGSWNQLEPAITLLPFAKEDEIAKDLRPQTGRNLERRTKTHPDYAERVLHTRYWSEGPGAGDGAVEYNEVTAYGDPTTDLRPQITHETWGNEENTAAMQAVIERVKARTWQTFLTTRIDFDIWLSHPILIDDNTVEWVNGITYDFAAGTMQLELTHESGTPILPTGTLTWARGTRHWQDINSAWKDADWITNR